jgi:hypothetical protein
MTLELLTFQRQSGYAGALEARHPILAGRFHFWRGASGRCYACTRFRPNTVPAYDHAVILFVRRRGSNATVLGLGTSPTQRAPLGTDEVHLHLVQGGVDEFDATLEDLGVLVAARRPLQRPALRIAA